MNSGTLLSALLLFFAATQCDGADCPKAVSRDYAVAANPTGCTCKGSAGGIGYAVGSDKTCGAGEMCSGTPARMGHQPRDTPVAGVNAFCINVYTLPKCSDTTGKVAATEKCLCPKDSGWWFGCGEVPGRIYTKDYDDLAVGQYCLAPFSNYESGALDAIEQATPGETLAHPVCNVDEVLATGKTCTCYIPGAWNKDFSTTAFCKAGEACRKLPSDTRTKASAVTGCVKTCVIDDKTSRDEPCGPCGDISYVPSTHYCKAGNILAETDLGACASKDGNTATTSKCTCGTATCEVGQACTESSNTCTDPAVPECTQKDGGLNSQGKCKCPGGTSICDSGESCYADGACRPPTCSASDTSDTGFDDDRSVGTKNDYACSCLKADGTYNTCEKGQACSNGNGDQVKGTCAWALCANIRYPKPKIMFEAESKRNEFKDNVKCLCPGGPASADAADKLANRGADKVCTATQVCVRGAQAADKDSKGGDAVCACMGYHNDIVGGETDDCTCFGGPGSGTGKNGADATCKRGQGCNVGLCAFVQDDNGQNATCTDAPNATCGTTGWTSTKICAAGADKTLILVKPATTECAGTDCTQAECCRKHLCAANQYVTTNHTCAACPAGKTNVANDDASGNTTACDDEALRGPVLSGADRTVASAMLATLVALGVARVL